MVFFSNTFVKRRPPATPHLPLERAGVGVRHRLPCRRCSHTLFVHDIAERLLAPATRLRCTREHGVARAVAAAARVAGAGGACSIRAATRRRRRPRRLRRRPARRPARTAARAAQSRTRAATTRWRGGTPRRRTPFIAARCTYFRADQWELAATPSAVTASWLDKDGAARVDVRRRRDVGLHMRVQLRRPPRGGGGKRGFKPRLRRRGT